ncbi:hypothetical protein F7984_11770 [Pradoshia sp. D12]|uniref:hypothetical protein n=1 Tax=Bacillaceae TaxID=186817 RepID=UPI00112D1463|nr:MULTISPECIES: hypothetical protein [Bacillaceae]QFK71859.1 hypothetical protein F7984_11770 [Pradoshia sp. D12]TPF73654.1 hypothetical protein FHY44_08170 [Bacillus sp. D12]
MKILSCIGYELEKEKPNSPEDFFNRSTVTYKQNGKIKEFQVIYLRYFEEVLLEQEGEWVSEVQELLTGYTLKDIIALLCLLQNSHFHARKRVYINSEAIFLTIFKDLPYAQIKEILNKMQKNPEV